MMKFMRLASIGCSILVIVGILLTKKMAETFWLTGALLYAPPAGWLLPLLILLPGSLLLDRAQFPLHLATLLFVIFYSFEWKAGKGLKLEEADFTVLTNNIGQSGDSSFRKFSESINPDLILLQAVEAKVYRFPNSFPGYHAAASGEFGILSKHKILDAKPVPGLERPVASRFVIDVDGQEVVIYNVHLPTPRNALGSLRGNGFLHSLLKGGGVLSASVRQEFQEFMDRSIRMAKVIAKEAAGETAPVILGGDFNAPSQGIIARTLSEQFYDAHRKTGHGCGFTLPGRTRNPLSLFGPFMRIDHIYSNSMLKPVGCTVEKKRPSQHRAVAAGYSLLWK